MAGENGNGNGGPSLQMVTLLQKAAGLRALGQTWAQVAEQCNRAEGTCRNWTHEHRSLWEQLYAEASTKVWDEAEAEARHVQRQLLRSSDERVRQSAAHSLMACARQSRPQRLEVTQRGDPFADIPKEEAQELGERADRALLLIEGGVS